ncbi:MAG: ABC transporter substrate-binding protein [Sulfolobales archaeon]
MFRIYQHDLNREKIRDLEVISETHVRCWKKLSAYRWNLVQVIEGFYLLCVKWRYEVDMAMTFKYKIRSVVIVPRFSILIAKMLSIVIVMLSLLIFVANMDQVSAQQLPIPLRVPRGDVLIEDQHIGTIPNPKRVNPYVPGGGLFKMNAYCWWNLWYVNSTNGELISVLANPPVYSENYTVLRITLKPGIRWSDGVPMTADDIVFTINMLRSNRNLSGYAVMSAWVKDVYKEDDLTAVVVLNRPNPRFHLNFAWAIGLAGILIAPKHVWEKVDPVTFDNFPPLCTGPYVLQDVDPAGNWALWVRNETWWGTVLYGIKPGPKYILSYNYGNDQKKALAMINHQLDWVLNLAPEAFETVWNNIREYVNGFRASPPIGWFYTTSTHGIRINVLRYPLNYTEVRWALIFSLNYTVIWEAFKGPDGTAPVPALFETRRPLDEQLYYRPLKQQLLELGLDPNPPKEIQDYIATYFPGVHDPTLIWWKYDPDKAAQLLMSVGFKRDSQGNWYTPDGKRFSINIIAFPETVPQRLAYLAADQWKRFGIDVTVTTLTSGTVFNNRILAGDFDLAAYTIIGSTIASDLTPHITWMNSKYAIDCVNQPGAQGGSTFPCYNFPERKYLDSLLDQLEVTPPGDPKIPELIMQVIYIWLKYAPAIAFFSPPFYEISDTYCWAGWPRFPDNYYIDPGYHWPTSGPTVLLSLYPTGRCETKDAAMPKTPGKPPVEIISPINATMPTPSTGVKTPTGITTSISTITMTTIQTTTITATIAPTIAPPSPQGMSIPAVIAIAAVTMIIGIVVGYLLRRRGR